MTGTYQAELQKAQLKKNQFREFAKTYYNVNLMSAVDAYFLSKKILTYNTAHC